jgi:hypothetical protein
MHFDLGSSGYFLEDFLFVVILIPWTQFPLRFTSGNYDSVCFLGHTSHMDHSFTVLPPLPQKKKKKKNPEITTAASSSLQVDQKKKKKISILGGASTLVILCTVSV